MLRAAPACEVLLYDKGAEGFPLEEGFDLYDVPAKNLHLEREKESGHWRPNRAWSYLSSLRSPTGFPEDTEPALMVIPEIGVVCPRPRVVYQDTITSEFNFFGGSWEQRLTFYPPRTNRLVQYSNAADSVWRAESVYTVPLNANIAFTLQRLDNHHNHDWTVYPGYVQVIIGNAIAIRFSRTETAGIWLRVAGKWQQYKHVNLTGARETMVWVKVRQGAVCISFDFGEDWEIIRGEAPLNVPAAPIYVEGAGCQMAFGFHQLAADDCSFLSYELPIYEDHLASPVPSAYGYAPTGTTIQLLEWPSSPATLRYQALFEVSTTVVPILSFPMYNIPELYATLWRWPHILNAPVGSSVDLASVAAVDEVDITEPEDMRERSGSVHLVWHPNDAFSGSYGNRLVRVKLGWLMEDGSLDLTTRCHMYLVEPSPEARGREWDASVSLDLTDLWLRATTTKVDEGWMPLDGQTFVFSRNYALNKMGLPTTRGVWYNSGATLPSGTYLEPKWWPKPGMTVAEFFESLDVIEGTETFVDPDGNFTSRLARYVDTLVFCTFDGDGTTPTDYLFVRQGTYRAVHRDNKTAVLVRSSDQRNGSVWATSINYNLERDVTNNGFVGHRRWERIENAGVVSLAEAMLVAAIRRDLLDDVPQDLELKVPGQHDLFRGHKIAAVNMEHIGVGGTERYRVASLTHRWRPTKSETETDVRARRVS